MKNSCKKLVLKHSHATFPLKKTKNKNPAFFWLFFVFWERFKGFLAF